MSDEPMIGFGGGDDDDEMPPEMREHMLAAFAHKAGLGPHPGMYKGPPRRKRVDSDNPTDTDRQRAEEEPFEDEEPLQEASAGKMKAAQRGEVVKPLAPSQMEQTAVTQQGALGQQADVKGAAQAAQAQRAQAPSAPPAAPGGPAGATEPYKAEKGQTPPGIPEAPPAPGGAE